MQKYALDYTDAHRTELEQAFDANELMAMLPSDFQMIQQFVRYTKSNGIDTQWSYINSSASLICNQLKALIARDVLGIGAYYEISNLIDTTVASAIKHLQDGKADFPITESEIASQRSNAK